VDDEPRLRQVLVRLMKGDGFECYEAGSGKEALAVLEVTPVTLLLSDLRMPEMDGMELLRHVRARFPATAVILITAVAEVEVAVGCLALGAMDYLTKPIQALEKRRLILENRDYQERLEERVAAQARRLEELFLASIQSLAEALEVKDRYTRGHSIRVSQYSTMIARAMDLESEVVRQVEIGGHVHDIGKIGVREAVLNKAGALSEEEYKHIMTHPMLGWRILSPLLTDMPLALNIVRSHHERFDGRGIPDGVGGKQIPLEARIAAAADAFDAMTSIRPYRHGKALTLEAAVAEMRRCSGTKFDPDVLAAFVPLLESSTFTLPPMEITAEQPVG
jgi:response regulator RpfG family c-di-GMP phosphodiesterase